MQNRNVVFLVYYLSKNGGTERVTSIIANELAKSGYNITILSLEGNENGIYFPFNPGVKVAYLNPSAENGIGKLFSSIKKIRDFNRQNKTDVLISVESMLTMFATPSVAGTPVRHIVWEHFNFNVDLGKPARRLARQLAATCADAVVTLTKRDVELWTKKGWVKRADVINIPNPVFLHETPHSDLARTKTVICVGRLTYQKGFDLMIDAWKQVPESLRKEWKLQIIGEGPDRPKLEAQIRQYGLEQSVALPGATKKVFEYFQQASIFCLSSRFEGLPMVLLEALSFQIPIVSFDCDTGPRELIDDNENGVLVENGNVSKLAEALTYLMKNESVLESMRAHESVKIKALDLSSIIQKWREVIQ